MSLNYISIISTTPFRHLQFISSFFLHSHWLHSYWPNPVISPGAKKIKKGHPVVFYLSFSCNNALLFIYVPYFQLCMLVHWTFTHRIGAGHFSFASVIQMTNPPARSIMARTQHTSLPVQLSVSVHRKSCTRLHCYYTVTTLWMCLQSEALKASPEAYQWQRACDRPGYWVVALTSSCGTVLVHGLQQRPAAVTAATRHVKNVYCLRGLTRASGDKMNLTANVKITDNHKSWKWDGVSDES